MIDLEFAIEKFALLCGISVAEAQHWRGLVASSAMKVSQLLREDAPQSAVPIAAQCAAADAYYVRCLCECARADSAVTAGAVTIRTEIKARIDSARALRDAAVASLAPYLRDDGFAFLHV